MAGTSGGLLTTLHRVETWLGFAQRFRNEARLQNGLISHHISRRDSGSEKGQWSKSIFCCLAVDG
jgi:hypothetical protein